MTFAIVGTAEEIRDLMLGPLQHNEHCRGHLWELYMQDQRKRIAAMNECARQIIARANSQIEYSEAAE